MPDFADPLEVAIAKSLSRDALGEAEQITGESYKDDSGTGMLGMMLQHDVLQQRKALLSVAGDTYFGMEFSRAITVFEKNGFYRVFREMFKGHADEETFCIFWHPDGLLLHCSSCYMRLDGGNAHWLDSGNVYYNWKPFDDKGYPRVPGSGGFKDGVWGGNLDVREGLIHNLTCLRAGGKFVCPWEYDPCVCLYHCQEEKVAHDSCSEGYKGHMELWDLLKEITRGKISKLPQKIQKGVGCIT